MLKTGLGCLLPLFVSEIYMSMEYIFSLRIFMPKLSMVVVSTFIYICYLWKEALPLIELYFMIYTIHSEWLYDIYHSFWMVAQTLSQQWTLQTRRYGKETIITVTVQITWCRCSIICFSCPYGCFDIDVDCWPFWMSRCFSTRRLVR